MIDNGKIEVTVKLFADFLDYGPAKTNLTLLKGSTINTILEKYNIPKEKTKMIILVNRIPKYDRNMTLHDGDTIALFPPLAGG
ncbi:MAG: MoaD/ThiS family protein [Candidatus Lokiarchaeota archaeon]|nr:MoaD/ThiS family protein [Candidatus Lokiarchaeota archaeon]MBD3342860.1 MoaD/ThiS family protein [Candidatus Lokiarchaeota archaeon]